LIGKRYIPTTLTSSFKNPVEVNFGSTIHQICGTVTLCIGVEETTRIAIRQQIKTMFMDFTLSVQHSRRSGTAPQLNCSEEELSNTATPWLSKYILNTYIVILVLIFEVAYVWMDVVSIYLYKEMLSAPIIEQLSVNETYHIPGRVYYYARY